MADDSAAQPLGHDTDDALIEATLGNDDQAFAELVRRYADRVARLVARFARGPHDLAELSQDVFIDVHRNLHRFDRRSPLEHWICRIATRRCYDYLRRHYRRRWWTSLDALQEDGFEPAPAHVDHSSQAPSPRVAALHDAIRRLPPDQRTLITLLELEGYSPRDAAALTGWTEGNVRIRAYRARAALRKALENETL